MSELTNPAGAYGLTAFAADETIDLIAANAIGDKEVVALSTSNGCVIRSLAATARGLQIGVAAKAAASGGAITVITGGFATVKKGTAAITAGEVVVQDNTVSGAVKSLSTATAISIMTDVRGVIGTAVATVSAAATEVVIYVGKF